MRGFRLEKLAPDPKLIRGWRTIRAGGHRLLLALLPGGTSQAVKVFHPVRENPSRHHCSICSMPGHDRRAHRYRRNVDGYIDEEGRFRPIRGSPGYNDGYVRVARDERRALGIRTSTYQTARREPALMAEILSDPETRRQHDEYVRSQQRIEGLHEKRQALAERIADDRAAELTDLIRRAGKDRGAINRIPWEQGRAVLQRYGGKMPTSTAAVVKDAQGRRYVRWEYVLDTVADELGYGSSDRLKDAIEHVQQDKQKLRDLDADIRDLEHAARRNPQQHRVAQRRY